MEVKINRLMIAAPTSGSGKTTVVCGLLKALLNQQLNTVAFKSGPDYIDPMFHSKVIGAKSRNLDLFLLGKEITKYLLVRNANKADIAILEGAMGFYDGLGSDTRASAYELAQVTQTPVVLLINAKGAALSLAAIIKGFKDFRSDSNIQGVILNNVNPMTYAYYKEALERETGVPLLGYFPHLAECNLESRHLGLVTAEEVQNLQDIIASLATQATKTLNLPALLALAEQAPPLSYTDIKVQPLGDVTIAVAQDKAFCFYYQDALDLLAELGVQLVSFSPLADKKLPSCDGVILGGGYPEVYATQLSENKELRLDLSDKIAAGLPTLAECGGFMYLLDKFVGNEQEYAWVGAVTGSSSMTKKLNRFGYITLTAQKDNMLCHAGDTINAHEFHYSDSTNNGVDFVAAKNTGKRSWPCIHATSSLYAGYPHMHLWGNRNFAINFIKACLHYKDEGTR